MEESRTIDGKSALLSAYKRSTLWVKAYEDLRNPMEQVLDPSASLREGRDDKGRDALQILHEGKDDKY